MLLLQQIFSLVSLHVQGDNKTDTVEGNLAIPGLGDITEFNTVVYVFDLIANVGHHLFVLTCCVIDAKKI